VQPLPIFQIYYPDGSGSETVLEVSNHDTRIWNCPVALQNLITAATSYPTASALGSTGWRPPEASQGGQCWDGWIRLTKWPTQGPGLALTGLLPTILEIVRQSGFPHRVEDLRERPEPGCPDTGPLDLFPYQREAADLAVREGRGVLDMPPRSGKTRVGIEITRQISLPTLWIAPTTNIVNQTVRAFDAQLGRNYAVALKGASTWRDQTHVPVIVCTAATAALLPAEFFLTRKVLFFDEFHHGASQQYHAIAMKCRHIFYRYGMSGTFFRSTQRVNGQIVNDELSLHAILSKVIYKVDTRTLVDAKRLVPLSVVFLPVIAPKLKSFTGMFNVGVGRHGIYQHEYRNRLVAWAAATLHAKGRRTLVLVATKEQGYAVRSAVQELIGKHQTQTQFAKVEFVSTDRPPHVCQKIIDAFTNSDEVQVLVGTSMVGEGTDVPSCDALVYARGEKAEVSHTQAMYRVGTAYDGKRRAVVVDFADRHHSTLQEHSLLRAQTYCAESTATVCCLDSPEEFPGWLHSLLVHQ
jgi:superfamily II DNA or RNA helicase